MFVFADGKESILEWVCSWFVDAKLAVRQTFLSRFISSLPMDNSAGSDAVEFSDVTLFIVMLAKTRLVSAWPNRRCG